MLIEDTVENWVNAKKEQKKIRSFYVKSTLAKSLVLVLWNFRISYLFPVPNGIVLINFDIDFAISVKYYP